MRLNISIVLFKPKKDQLNKTISSLNFIKNYIDTVFLIDNSPSENKFYKNLSNDFFNFKYIYNLKNIGYGAAHNIAIRISSRQKLINYHLVLNPDIYFDYDICKELFIIALSDNKITNIMPRILNPDSSEQYLCKRLPTPIDKFCRRFFPYLYNDNNYVLKNLDKTKIYNVPSLSGCFMFLNVKNVVKLNLFDERFFMYEEDTDLSRKIYYNFKNIYLPRVFVYHSYEKGSYKKLRLLLFHIKSIFLYFSKYGWIFDSYRKKINKIDDYEYK
tara:strand:+ start:332 stop:1147 length:816 start_codon:yes stop_codon:yes gene_type:complete